MVEPAGARRRRAARHRVAGRPAAGQRRSHADAAGAAQPRAERGAGDAAGRRAALRRQAGLRPPGRARRRRYGVGISPEHLSRIFDLYFTTREGGQRDWPVDGLPHRPAPRRPHRSTIDPRPRHHLHDPPAASPRPMPSLPPPPRYPSWCGGLRVGRAGRSLLGGCSGAACAKKPVVVVRRRRRRSPCPSVPPRLVGPVQVEEDAAAGRGRAARAPAPRTTPRPPRGHPRARPTRRRRGPRKRAAGGRRSPKRPRAAGRAPSPPPLLRTRRDRRRPGSDAAGSGRSSVAPRRTSSKVNYKGLSTTARAQHDTRHALHRPGRRRPQVAQLHLRPLPRRQGGGAVRQSGQSLASCVRLETQAQARAAQGSAAFPWAP